MYLQIGAGGTKGDGSGEFGVWCLESRVGSGVGSVAFQAACDLDAGGRESGVEAGDGLAAVAFGLGGDGATPDDDEVWRCLIFKRNNSVAFGKKPGFVV